jgi:tRNA pseudouridine32 synthase / 23S rRNA pseudouridine746 synthase
MDNTPSFTDITVLHQDRDLLILNKPADLLTVPGRGVDKQDCLIHRTLKHYPSARIVHRLDMATSGIVIMALNHSAQAAMGSLFAQRKIKKVYIAIVAGNIAEQVSTSGMVDLPLICDWENRPKQIVDTEKGKTAQTHFKSIAYDNKNDISLVELTPITGRSHQLRVHMLALGHPIIGDYFYAPENIKRKSVRLLLHAQEVSFEHPFTKKSIQITSAPPFDLATISPCETI